MTYSSFLQQKAIIDPPAGLSYMPDLHPALFAFQADICRWALRRGRAAVFAGTGLGKSLIELSYADAVVGETHGSVLILAPLAVAQQLAREAAKFGIHATLCREVGDVRPGINITNYDRMERFDADYFDGVVLDESSLLKGMASRTRLYLTEAFRDTPYRLAATATPAPNDFMELGNHAEFLGVLSMQEMLSTFFINDQTSTKQWRLKGHALDSFWRWVASWGVMLRHPRDLGYEDERYDLPALNQHEHVVAHGVGELAKTLGERQRAKRESIAERVAKAAALVNESDAQWIVWCHLNAEQDALQSAIPDAISLRGADTLERKEQGIRAFCYEGARVLVSKPSMFGYGLNLQSCHNMAFVGLNDSWEQIYQAVRRCYRFGQEREVNVHFIAAEAEGAVLENIHRKEAQADEMAAAMVTNMADITKIKLNGARRHVEPYEPGMGIAIPGWLRSEAQELEALV